MLIRFRPDVVNLKPKAVVIMAGTNDLAGNTGLISVENTAENIFSMAEIAIANKIAFKYVQHYQRLISYGQLG